MFCTARSLGSTESPEILRSRCRTSASPDTSGRAEPACLNSPAELRGREIVGIEPLLNHGPWALVLVVCGPVAAIVIMFVFAMLLVPKDKRVDAIKAMAELVRAIKSGKRGQVP